MLREELPLLSSEQQGPAVSGPPLIQAIEIVNELRVHDGQLVRRAVEPCEQRRVVRAHSEIERIHIEYRHGRDPLPQSLVGDEIAINGACLTGSHECVVVTESLRLKRASGLPHDLRQLRALIATRERAEQETALAAVKRFLPAAQIERRISASHRQAGERHRPRPCLRPHQSRQDIDLSAHKPLLALARRPPDEDDIHARVTREDLHVVRIDAVISARPIRYADIRPRIMDADAQDGTAGLHRPRRLEAKRGAYEHRQPPAAPLDFHIPFLSSFHAPFPGTSDISPTLKENPISSKYT